MTDELGRAAKARALLENQLFIDAFEGVRRAIFDRIERCPVKDTETAEDLRRCLKLLRDVRLNLEVMVQDGKVEEFKIKQEEQKGKARRLGLIPGFFR